MTPPALPEFSWLVEQFPYPGLFALLILGSIGLPLPEDAILLFCGFLISGNVVAPVPAALVVYLGVLAGDFVIFSVGRKYGRSIITNKRFYRLLSPERFSVLESKFKKFGIFIIFFGRHLWGFRAQIFLASGILGVNPRKFVLADALAAIITVTVMLTIGYNGARTVQDLDLHSLHAGHIITGVAVIIAAFILIKSHKNAEAKRTPAK